MFISTWGLNESGSKGAEEIQKKKWYGCENFLIAYKGEKHPDGLTDEKMIKFIKSSLDCTEYDIDNLPDNFYYLK